MNPVLFLCARMGFATIIAAKRQSGDEIPALPGMSEPTGLHSALPLRPTPPCLQPSAPPPASDRWRKVRREPPADPSKQVLLTTYDIGAAAPPGATAGSASKSGPLSALSGPLTGFSTTSLSTCPAPSRVVQTGVPDPYRTRPEPGAPNPQFRPEAVLPAARAPKGAPPVPNVGRVCTGGGWSGGGGRSRAQQWIFLPRVALRPDADS